MSENKNSLIIFHFWVDMNTDHTKVDSSIVVSIWVLIRIQVITSLLITRCLKFVESDLPFFSIKFDMKEEINKFKQKTQHVKFILYSKRIYCYDNNF